MLIVFLLQVPSVLMVWPQFIMTPLKLPTVLDAEKSKIEDFNDLQSKIKIEIDGLSDCSHFLIALGSSEKKSFKICNIDAGLLEIINKQKYIYLLRDKILAGIEKLESEEFFFEKDKLKLLFENNQKTDQSSVYDYLNTNFKDFYITKESIYNPMLTTISNIFNGKTKALVFTIGKNDKFYVHEFEKDIVYIHICNVSQLINFCKESDPIEISSQKIIHLLVEYALIAIKNSKDLHVMKEIQVEQDLLIGKENKKSIN